MLLTQCHYNGWQQEAHGKVEVHSTLFVGMTSAYNTTRGDVLQMLAEAHSSCRERNASTNGELRRCVR